MPRLSHDFLDSVLYLYRSAHEATEGMNIGGSGFLASVPAETIPNGNFVYAVTNRHVIAVADYVRLNTQEGGTHIERLPRENWIRSKTDDLAIMAITVPHTVFAQRHVGSALIMSKEYAGKIKLGIGDDVFMVGRFINHEGKQKNAPLVRFGSIAQMPSEPLVYDLEGKRHEQESIIADIRSIGGYSGSPVFLKEPNFIKRPDGGEAPDKHYLVGIDWGHIKMWSPVCGFDEKPIGYTQVNINSGMAGVIPAWKLLDMLMEDNLVKHRKLEEEKYRSANATTPAATDLSVPPSTEENPKHREDFTSLVTSAARKQKPDE